MGSVVTLAQNGDFTGRQLELIRQTVANDCNAQEFNLFCEVARRHGLDPFRKQISALVFSKDDPAKRKLTIITNIDGLRSIAARSLRYRPDEEAPRYTYDEALKDPLCNPLGLERAEVRIYIRDEGGESWRPVTGVAYWDEYAPIKEEGADGFSWVETGEKHPEGHAKAGQPKYRKQMNGSIVRKLDTTGNWGRMGRVMLAKCAEAQALRKAFPEDLSGLYEGSELDQARAAERLATDIIADHQTEDRLARVGALGGITFQLTPTSALEPIPLGQVADRILEAAKDFDLQQHRWFESANTHPMREFWARSKADALDLKRQLDAMREKLLAEAQT